MTKKHTCTCEKYSPLVGESKSMISVSGQKPDCFAFARNDAVSLTRKSAFTLAETLIALAIIGIVAALTIPTLMTNITENQFKTGQSTFQRKFGEALRVMNTQGELGGYTTTEQFVTALSKHIKILKTCDNNHLTECFSSTLTSGEDEFDVTTLKKSSNLGREWTHDTDVMGIQFVNGVSALLAYNPDCPADRYNNELFKLTGTSTDKKNSYVRLEDTTNEKCISMIFDVNSNGKPNTVSNDVVTNPKDIGTINVSLSKGPECFATTTPNGVCLSEVKSGITPEDTCDGTNKWDKNYTSSVNPDYCKTNYWAGAKRYCEEELGMELPDKDALKKLMKEDTWEGKPTSNDGYFWSGPEYNADHAWYVYPSGTVHTGSKYGSGAQVLCVGGTK